MKRRWRAARVAAGPILLAIIAWRIDRGALLDTLAAARGGLLVAAAVAVLPAIPLRAARWSWVLGALGERHAPADVLRIYAAGTFAGTATPGRVGELVRVVALAEIGASPLRAVASVLVDRVWDVALVAAVALVWVAPLVPAPHAIAAAVAAATLIAVAWAAPRALEPWLAWRAALGAREAILVARASVARPAFAGPPLIASALLTLLSGVAVWASNHCAVLALGLPLGPLQTAGVTAVAGLAAMLPVSLLGAGTRDAAVLVALGAYGIPASDALALSTTMLVLNLWIGVACAPATLIPVTVEPAS